MWTLSQRLRRVRHACVGAFAVGVVVAGPVLAGQAASDDSGQTPTRQVEILNPAAALQPAQRVRLPNLLAFPLQTTPRCEILDNFGDARSGSRRHEGVDMLAALGQEVYAVGDGYISDMVVDGQSGSSLSGNGISLTTTTARYAYAHLSGFAAGLEIGSEVAFGQLIGYVGDTGNPGPGNYHLHFEIHPLNGAAVDPLGLLAIPAGCRVY